MNHSTTPGGFQQPPFPRVERVRTTFGDDATLIPTRPGTKEPFQKGYNNFGIEKMSDPEHLALLEKSNIAILTGPSSGNLISIDFDSDEAYEEFRVLNPHLCETRRTVGARGCNLWLRLTGSYPKGMKKLFGRGGSPVGEWRGGDCITVVDGKHPKGMAYRIDPQFLLRVIAFEDIRWPEDWTGFPGQVDLFEDLTKRVGDPFAEGGGGSVQVNESFIVGWMLAENQIVHATENGRFYVYDENAGIWMYKSDPEVHRLITDYITRLAIESGMGRIHLQNRSGNVRSIRQHLAAMTTKLFFEPLALNGWVVFPANSGAVALILPTKEEPAQISPYPYSSTFRFTWKSSLDFAPGAVCPRFQEELLVPVLHPEDIQLLQRLCGLMLIGANDIQKILLLEGAGGLGKGTFVRILQLIVGVAATEELRTRHLGSRFETARFVGRRILLGQDVPQDFLSTAAAAFLKTLTGGDTVGVERKGSNEAGYIKGDFHVIITSNAPLAVRVEADADAWMRRLIVIPFHRPIGGETKRVPKLEEILVHEEGEGILNWFLKGACEALGEIQEHGSVRLTDAQLRRVDDRVRRSDTVAEFLGLRLVAKAGARVASHALWAGYLSFCEAQGAWAVPERSFQLRIKQEMNDRWGAQVQASENVVHGGKRCRGYFGVELSPDVPEAVNTHHTDDFTSLVNGGATHQLPPFVTTAAQQHYNGEGSVSSVFPHSTP